MNHSPRIIKGTLSGKDICLPEVNDTSKTTINPALFVTDGAPVQPFNWQPSVEHPDAMSFRRKFGLLIPVTNTSMEYELWNIIINNRESGNLDGVGLHTTNIQIPKIPIHDEAGLEQFRNSFVEGLERAVQEALLARPEYLIMGMSLEHIIHGLDHIRALMNRINTGISWATWHEAADAALKKFNAKRIGLISPFIAKGNENARRMFEDLGYEVVVTFGFGCPDLVDIAHIPDAAKEEVILHHLATPSNRLDAVVQLGTNMSLTNIVEQLEHKTGLPVLGINAVTFWYALRENGFTTPLVKAGRLLREF